MSLLPLFHRLLLKSINKKMKKIKALLVTLLVAGVSFGQLNNCINTKEHPLIAEIMDSLQATKSFNSVLAFTVINRNELSLSRNKVLNLAYAWAACKKIKDPTLRKEEELKFIDAFFNNEELEKLVSYLKKYRGEQK